MRPRPQQRAVVDCAWAQVGTGELLVHDHAKASSIRSDLRVNHHLGPSGVCFGKFVGSAQLIVDSSKKPPVVALSSVVGLEDDGGGKPLTGGIIMGGLLCLRYV